MRKIIFLLTTFCLMSTCIRGQNISFIGKTEKVVVVGQQFRVSYTLTTEGETGKDAKFGDTKDFNILFGPVIGLQSFSHSTVNGKTTALASSEFIFTLSAKSEGTFKIPPATIKVGNSEYKSNEIEIKVLPQDQAANAAAANASANISAQQDGQPATQSGSQVEDIFVRMHVSKYSVYENEGFLVTFKLYTLVNLRNFHETPKFPEFDGFMTYEIEMPSEQQITQENYNGRNYGTIIFKQYFLYPQRTGKITIPAGKFSIITQVRRQQRQRSIFDDFFSAYEDVIRPLTTTPVTIDVKPLPPGKPASFSGAVGDYKMTTSISTNQLKANDAVTIKATISGNGNIKLIKNPVVVFPNDFDVLEPEVSVTTKVSAYGVSGSKAVTYNAIPRYAGNFTIPAIEFSYFDVKSGTYKTLKSDDFQLVVEQGEGGAAVNSPIVNASNKENIRFLGKDIRFIKTGSADFHRGDFFFGTLNYLLFYIIPALLFIIIFWIYRHQAAQNANIALVRTKKASKVASRRLKTAAKYLKENKSELFYDETLKAVWGYLSDKLNIPVSALTKDNVDANLTKYGVDKNLIKEFREILDTAEFARYAPAQAVGKMDDLYDATVQAIDKMENTI